MRRIRTSRPLDYACVYNVDFLWLAEGLVPDHSTLAEFFSKFRPELKSLFKQVCKIAMTMGLICVMPNKEGGFAPNFTPACLTDGQSGFILDAAVIYEVNEHPEALPAVDRATPMCDESPVNFLADGGMATARSSPVWKSVGSPASSL